MGNSTNYQCPYCWKQPTYKNNFMKHLTGTAAYDGHELSGEDARFVIDEIDHGRMPPNLEDLVGQDDPLQEGQQNQRGPSGTAVKSGHWHALELLQYSAAVQNALRLYRKAIEAPVYLRVTGRGLTVISLDHKRCMSMIGVGPRDSTMEYLTEIPVDPGYINQAVDGYIQKRDSLMRESEEEQFSLKCIDHALQNGLQLPGGDLYFIHQEWRIPTKTGSGKLDLLAVDLKAGRLAVIELKSEKRKVQQRDKYGFDAAGQARNYANVIFNHRQELYPFFQELARATAKVWGGPPAMKELELRSDHVPRCEVWTPEYRQVVQ